MVLQNCSFYSYRCALKLEEPFGQIYVDTFTLNIYVGDDFINERYENTRAVSVDFEKRLRCVLNDTGQYANFAKRIV